MGRMPKEVANRIAKAKATNGGNHIRYGEYVLMLMRSSYEKTHSGQCHINEFFVVENKKTPVVEGDKTVEVEPNTVGSSCSYVINYDGKGKQSAEGNSKALVLGIFGLKEDDVTEENLTETLGDLTDDNQPAKGMVVRCSTYPKEVRSRPGNFITGLKWACIDAPGTGQNSPENVKARLDALANAKETQAA